MLSMEFTLISIGKINTSWILAGIAEFEKRLSKYIRFSPKIIPDLKKAKSLSLKQIKEEEGKNLVNEMNPSDFVVLLDERGREFSSGDFANWLEKQLATGFKRILFIIGGPYGFSDEVYKRADAKIALSKMTFTHEMAKLFFTEQIYRAFTILNNEPYHHE